MKYTKEQLEAMSDFEINKLVSHKYLPCDYIVDEEYEQVHIAELRDVMIDYLHDQQLVASREFNPCNSWSDMGPIIFDKDIDLMSPTAVGTEEWMAVKFYPSLKENIESYSDNPLRAAAIVYLLMEE